ncbi:hypothetical protein PGT21_031182 [Puccinia graminis f. sp. tritici]|uniref:Uncharacterized protein n=1 Tax=Puccinia graminis f. sp. tritici TaxID=56615 RepID=A0A5B0P8E8_PUCGR|nr:hypothetical protein PGT21_031182 [Puccinia graminis f. sp. tritici]
MLRQASPRLGRLNSLEDVATALRVHNKGSIFCEYHALDASGDTCQYPTEDAALSLGPIQQSVHKRLASLLLHLAIEARLDQQVIPATDFLTGT